MIALAPLLASLAVSGPAVSATGPEPEPSVRWGLAVGLAGRTAFGDGISPPGSSVNEYARADLDLAVEVFALRLGRWVELAPYFTVRLAGGVNEALFEDAVDATNQANGDEPDLRVTGSDDIEAGLGARFFPARWGGLEPYIGVFGAYARSSVAVAPVDGGGGGPFGSVSGASHAREGFALSGALGARYGWTVQALDSPRLFVAAEARLTHGFWSGLDSSFGEAVGPEGLDLSRVGGFVWLGYQL